MNYQEIISFENIGRLHASFFTVYYDRGALGCWLSDSTTSTVGMTIPHFHKDVQEIVFVQDGDLSVRVNNYEGTMGKGDILVINGFDIHSLVGNGIVYVMQYNNSMMDGFYPSFKALFHIKDEKKIIHPLAPFYEEIAHELIEGRKVFFDKQGDYMDLVLGCIYKIIYYVNRIDTDYDENLDLHIQGRINHDRLKELFEYIEQNYTHEITLRQAASVMNYSDSYFCKFFKKMTGLTFYEYLNDFRCSKAVELLKTTNKSIAQISEMTGFSCSQYFSKVFKKQMGFVPSQVRRQEE